MMRMMMRIINGNNDKEQDEHVMRMNMIMRIRIK